MQEQMQQLQQQLEASQKICNPSSVSAQTPEDSPGPKPVIPKQKQSRAKPTTASRKTETQAGKRKGLLPVKGLWFSFGSCMCKKESLFSFQQNLHPLQSEELSKSRLFSSMN